jgi:hypothetical protein
MSRSDCIDPQRAPARRQRVVLAVPYATFCIKQAVKLKKAANEIENRRSDEPGPH